MAERQTSPRLLSYLPLLIAIVMLLALTLWLYNACRAETGGKFIYTLDDTYIHMAIARNFAEHGVWGVTPYEFSSSSSSILWTLMIAAVYKVVGVNDLTPLLLNIPFAVLTLLAIHRLLLRLGISPLYSYVTLLAVIFLASLPSVIFTGLEHTLQMYLVVTFVDLAVQLLSREPVNPFSRTGALLAVVGFFSTFVRYEGLFLIAVACGLFLLRRQLRYAIVLGVISVLPITIYGLISMAQGWSFLPNPVFLGSENPNAASVSVLQVIGYNAYLQLQGSPSLLLMFVVGLVLFVLETGRERTLWRERALLLTFFLTVTFLHLEVTSKSSWLYRHEAYLNVLGITTLSAVFASYLPRHLVRRAHEIMRYAAVAVIILLVVMPLLERNFYLLSITPLASRNIYEQQVQMALFVKEFYPDARVAANDIGAVNYLTSPHTFDMYGLSNRDTAAAMRGHSYSTDLIRTLTERDDIDIAIVYPEWYNKYGGLPEEWTHVGDWTISGNVVTGGDTISFYAVKPEEAEPLEAALRQFSAQLPATVAQTGPYTEAASAP